MSSGLHADGYDYINLDDFWYDCPGSQGPDVDSNGRWVTNASTFPPSGSTNGIEVVANYVHSLGLKFGIYVTPGISDQAVADKSPIAGTSYTANEIADGDSENNYNCGGMQGIDFSKPGAQAFINSWADEFASWGVDYLKLDGVGPSDTADVQAWSTALNQSGRPILLELSNSLNINDGTTWSSLANSWRTGGDVECYCGSNGSSYPLTDWNNVSARFNAAASWQPYAGNGGWNDYDSTEVGNGSNDGLTAPERQTQLSLWSLASAPLLLGVDLTNLDSGDLALLKNTAVIAVDQDGIPADRVIDSGNEQVFDKRQQNGTWDIGIFNTDTSASHSFSVSLAQLGLTGSANITDLWSGDSDGTSTGTFTTTVAARRRHPHLRRPRIRHRRHRRARQRAIRRLPRHRRRPHLLPRHRRRDLGLQRRHQPGMVTNLRRRTAHHGRHRVPRRLQQRDRPRHQSRTVALQRRRQPEMDRRKQRHHRRPAIRPLPRRHRRQHGRGHPDGDLDLQRRREPEMVLGLPLRRPA